MSYIRYVKVLFGLVLLWLISLLWIAQPLPLVESNMAVSINESNQSLPLFVIRHGFHIGLGFDSAQVIDAIPELAARFKSYPFIEIGWGDRGYYQAEENSVSLTIKAMLWPTETVMHVVGMPVPPDEYFQSSSTQTICLNEPQYTSILEFVRNSFRLNQNKALIPLELGLYGDSQFYSAVGEFYWANTCNKWAATAINKAGFDDFIFTKLDADSVERWVSDLEYFVGSDALCEPPE